MTMLHGLSWFGITSDMYINPLNHVTMHYKVALSSTGKDLIPVFDWLEENIGLRGVQWCALSTGVGQSHMQPHVWYFLHEEDAVLFQLTWT